MSVAIARWTLDDYHTMINAGLFEGRPIELLNGWIVEISPEGSDHADLSTNANEYFIQFSQGRYRVRVDKPITLIETASEPEPDIALVKPQPYRNAHPSAEDVFLIIEFSRTSLTKDTEEKRQVYATAGIIDYWVANLRAGELIVYRDPLHGNYRSEQRLATGAISPLAFPDISIDVQMLLP
ncbi:MAG: Uma2 family endonuclease [Synechococcales cyanobacterium T60_A2020_003]|nr:Uma2 family endonuclease [Synechococcales cyanobacterium T60_A2020_003]